MERYEQLFNEYVATCLRHTASRQRLQERYDRALWTRWRELNPRKRKYDVESIPMSDRNLVFDRFNPTARRLARMQWAEIDSLLDELYRLAPTVEIIGCPEWHDISATYPSMYRSQLREDFAYALVLLYKDTLAQHGIENRFLLSTGDDSYHLMARIKPWRADAAVRGRKTTHEEMDLIFDKGGLKNRAYYPFLSRPRKET